MTSALSSEIGSAAGVRSAHAAGALHREPGLMKAILQGKWLGHPLHPLLVHLPMALWPAALVFDLTAYFKGDNGLLAQASLLAISFGLASALLAVPAGLADWWEIKRDKPAWSLGVYHMALNVLAMAIWTANLVVRLKEEPSGGIGAIPLALSLLGVLVLIASGYLGGRLVYEHGIGIARESKQKWRRIAEQGNAHLAPEQKGK